MQQVIDQKSALMARLDQEAAAGRAGAERLMAGFEYTCLVHTEDVEVWRCKKPGTGIYHFDITVLASGMAVTGDMDGMLFRVGSRYGIRFFANPDKTYVAEKLEEQSREYVFWKEEFDKRLLEMLVDRISEFLPDSPEERAETLKAAGVPCPDWLNDKGHASLTLAGVEQWLEVFQEPGAGETVKSLAIMSGADEVTAVRVFDGLYELFTELSDVESNESAHRFLYDNDDVLGVSDTFEIDLTRLDPHLIQRLYCLELAAKNILVLKEREAVAESTAEQRPRG